MKQINFFEYLKEVDRKNMHNKLRKNNNKIIK